MTRPQTPRADSTASEDQAERLLFSLSSLSEIGGLFTSETDFEKVAEAALRGVMGAVAASCGALLIFDGGCLRPLASRGIRRHLLPPVEVDETLRSLLTEAPAPLLLGRPGTWPGPLKPCAGAIRRLRACVWVPLSVRGGLLGVLSLGEKFLRAPYDTGDLQLLWTVGHPLSVGLYNHRLVAEVRGANFQLNRRVVELETLYDVGLTLSASLQVEEVIEEVLSQAVGILDARGGFLFLKDEKTGRFLLAHQVGLRRERVLTQPWMRRRVERVLRSGRPLRLGPGDVPAEAGIVHAAIAPVGELGAVGVVDKETRKEVQAFSEADVHLLELMGQQAGAALANARLYRDILGVKNYTQNILSSVGNGVISTDLRGRIAQVNPSVGRIFGGDEKLLGRSCARVFRRCGCRGVAEAAEASLRDGKGRQVDGERVKGSGVTLNARITALRNEGGEVQGLVIALEDLTEAMRLRAMFSQYASDQVVDLLLNRRTPPALGGERRDVTVLFVDMRGSTALLRRIGPEEMVALLNDCFARLNEVIFQHNGTLNKYTGDGFLVVYGAPVAFPDDRERAVRTALAMRDEMARFNRARGEPLGLAFGIARGKVVAGNVGSLRRMEYTVIGPAVVLASRFCDAARAGQIWVERDVYEELKGRFDFAHLGRQRFKGIEPVDVYEVLGPRGTRRRAGSKKDGRAMEEKYKKMEKKVDLTIPMVPEMELAASKTAEAVGEFMGLEEEKISEVKMALIEACINAFEHSQSKDRRVAITFDIGEEELTVRITDKGQGFDPKRAREESVKRRERRESRRGWGLTIMEGLMDEVKVQSDENGTVITMVKRR